MLAANGSIWVQVVGDVRRRGIRKTPMILQASCLLGWLMLVTSATIHATDVRPFLPTAPENARRGIASNADWWARNGEPTNCLFATVVDKQPVDRVQRATLAIALGDGLNHQTHGARADNGYGRTRMSQRLVPRSSASAASYLSEAMAIQSSVSSSSTRRLSMSDRAAALTRSRYSSLFA